MGAQAQAPIGSRWQDARGRIWTVIERKPFGVLDLKREDRAIFCGTRLSALLESHIRVG